jgi:type I site-specific restriction endonuclease
VSKSIISKSQIAQQKCSDHTILELSRKIADHQEKLQQEVKELANKRMVVITEINAAHKRDLYDLIDADNANCEEVYLNSVTESINEQIGLLEKISKETDDQPILKLVLEYLPDQYKLLRETESFRK